MSSILSNNNALCWINVSPSDISYNECIYNNVDSWNVNWVVCNWQGRVWWSSVILTSPAGLDTDS